MMTILELQKGYREGSFSVRQAVESFLERIKKLDQRIGAFITVCYNEALIRLSNGSEAQQRENIGPLGGIPLLLRTISALKTSEPPVLPGCWRILCPLVMPGWSKI